MERVIFSNVKLIDERPSHCHFWRCGDVRSLARDACDGGLDRDINVYATCDRDGDRVGISRVMVNL